MHRAIALFQLVLSGTSYNRSQFQHVLSGLDFFFIVINIIIIIIFDRTLCLQQNDLNKKQNSHHMQRQHASVQCEHMT